MREFPSLSFAALALAPADPLKIAWIPSGHGGQEIGVGAGGTVWIIGKDVLYPSGDKGLYRLKKSTGAPSRDV